MAISVPVGASTRAGRMRIGSEEGVRSSGGKSEKGKKGMVRK